MCLSGAWLVSEPGFRRGKRTTLGTAGAGVSNETGFAPGRLIEAPINSPCFRVCRASVLWEWIWDLIDSCIICCYIKVTLISFISLSSLPSTVPPGKIFGGIMRCASWVQFVKLSFLGDISDNWVYIRRYMHDGPSCWIKRKYGKLYGDILWNSPSAIQLLLHED